MQWFKHDSGATQDAKVKKLIIKYGAVGYAVYFHCLELIAADISESNLTFELEHDAEIVAYDLHIQGTADKSGQEIVEEIMRYIVDLGLFRESNGHIFCFRLLKQLDTSMSSSPKFRKMISEAKLKFNERLDSETGTNIQQESHDDIKDSHDDIMTESDFIMQDKNRIDKNRIDNDDIRHPLETSLDKKENPDTGQILYKKIKESFEKEGGRFVDYAREGKAIKRIIKLANGDEGKIMKMIDTFHRLTKSADKFWGKQPFLPSILCSGGIWPRVEIECAGQTRAEDDLSWYDEIVAKLQGGAK